MPRLRVNPEAGARLAPERVVQPSGAVDLRTGIPFWMRRGGLPFTYPALDTNLTADVVVVGAGISGALIARELAEAGAQVVVLERHDVASGSSAATTGLLLYDTDTSLAELSARVGH